MRHYEVAYIIDPTLEEEAQTGIIARFRQVVESRGGSVQDVDRWERRRLAYEVKGKREGNYVFMIFSADTATEAELGRLLGLADGVLRHMTVRIDEKKANAAVQRAEQRVVQAQEQARAAEQRAAEAAAAAAAPPPAPVSPAPEEAAPAASVPAPEESSPAAEAPPVESAAPAAEATPNGAEPQPAAAAEAAPADDEAAPAEGEAAPPREPAEAGA
jgi:small subunit ribosomal protein S6